MSVCHEIYLKHDSLIEAMCSRIAQRNFIINIVSICLILIHVVNKEKQMCYGGHLFGKAFKKKQLLLTSVKHKIKH